MLEIIYPDGQNFQIFCQFEQRIRINACVKYWKKNPLVLEMFIQIDKIFKYFVNLSKQKQRLVGHFEFDPDSTSQDT